MSALLRLVWGSAGLTHYFSPRHEQPDPVVPRGRRGEHRRDGDVHRQDRPAADILHREHHPWRVHVRGRVAGVLQ